MLDENESVDVARDLWWQYTRTEAAIHDRVYQYARGRAGRPDVPEGASEEIRELADLSVKNVLSIVVEAFAQNLSVAGFRSPTSADNEPVWDLWQRQRMDARQGEINRPAVQYGASYVPVTPGRSGGDPVFRPRSPRQLYAVYEDPQLDQWPVYALETWVDGVTLTRRGLLFDSTHMYPLDMGKVPVGAGDPEERFSTPGTGTTTIRLDPDRDPVKHGATGVDGEPVCPVVRFVSRRNIEDRIIGEVAPLIELQRSINEVNFDRLIVSRFGAFPQRAVIGWTAAASEILKASMSRIWTFDADPNEISLQSLPAAQVAPYNEVLSELLQHVALTAQIPVYHATGNVENVAADALALVDAPYQGKSRAMRESLGESYEQLLGLGARMAGIDSPDPAAEVVWRETEIRSFAQVVDGVTKLAAEGVPIEEMLDQIPGLTQQKIESIRNSIRRRGAQSTVQALAAAARSAQPQPPAQEESEPGGDAVAG